MRYGLQLTDLSYVILFPWVYVPSKAQIENAPFQERLQTFMVKGSTDFDTFWKYKFAKNRLLLKLLTLVVKEQRTAQKKKTFSNLFSPAKDLEITK